MFVAEVPRESEPEPDPAEMPTEQLEHEITALAAQINAGCCRWLELVAEFDRREGWGSWGCRSCAEWVAWQCALTTRSAREHVRVARRLEELPRIHEEFAAGRLSYSKVRALTRVAEPETEEDLLELARHATASQLERIVRGLRHVTTEEAAERQENRYLVTFWEEDGSLSVHAQLPPEEGAVFLRALDAAHDRLREADVQSARSADEGGSAEPPAESGSAEPRMTPIEHQRPGRHTHADALVELAAASHGARGSPERYEVVVHVDADVLSHDARGQVRIDDGPALAPETARRLGCDSSLISIIERGGEALSVGRRSRVVPPSLRRAVEARDGGCRFPGCEHRRFLDAHHIIHWAHGGSTDKGNLIMLCRHHHRLVHEGQVLVSGNADELVRFRMRSGTELHAAPRAPDSCIIDLLERNRRAGHHVGPDTCLTGSGEKMDRHWVVGVVADHLYSHN